MLPIVDELHRHFPVRRAADRGYASLVFAEADYASGDDAVHKTPAGVRWVHVPRG